MDSGICHFDFIPYPVGSFSWHHLWFIMYLWVIYLAGIPLFLVLRTSKGQRLFSNFSCWLLVGFVYPFYILHQTLMVGIGFYLVDWDWAWPFKLFILMAGTFFGTWGIYHFLIRPLKTH